MAAMEIPQAKSLVCVTSYTNDNGKVVHRNSTFSGVRIDAPVQTLLDAGSAIFTPKSFRISDNCAGQAEPSCRSMCSTSLAIHACQIYSVHFHLS